VSATPVIHIATYHIRQRTLPLCGACGITLFRRAHGPEVQDIKKMADGNPALLRQCLAGKISSRIPPGSRPNPYKHTMLAVEKESDNDRSWTERPEPKHHATPPLGKNDGDSKTCLIRRRKPRRPTQNGPRRSCSQSPDKADHRKQHETHSVPTRSCPTSFGMSLNAIWRGNGNGRGQALRAAVQD